MSDSQVCMMDSLRREIINLTRCLVVSRNTIKDWRVNSTKHEHECVLLNKQLADCRRDHKHTSVAFVKRGDEITRLNEQLDIFKAACDPGKVDAKALAQLHDDSYKP